MRRRTDTYKPKDIDVREPREEFRVVLAAVDLARDAVPGDLVGRVDERVPERPARDLAAGLHHVGLRGCRRNQQEHRVCENSGLLEGDAAGIGGVPVWMSERAIGVGREGRRRQ